ncbi:MAG TPA: glycosyltransferase, partial [Candidatus Eisenbacteria bacterium]|nr:glycosyltransferase [Candidatus Eisenbacteria bacterium]
VITTPNAGVSSFIEEGRNGFLVPPADVDALAAVLDRCLAEPSRLDAMREAARDSARAWTWKQFRDGFAEGLHEKVAAR